MGHVQDIGGETYSYTYDPAGNRLQQVIGGDTATYTYDAANRLATVNGVGYTFDANGTLLTSGSLTNTYDAANRLVTSQRVGGSMIEPLYDGVGNRVAQTVGVTTTYFALDIQGLPEVVYTSDGNAYLHLPGVIVTENTTGTVRYLLSDGLGSVRHAVDENAAIITYKEFDPYGNPLPTAYSLLPTPFGYTGEWWEDDVGLLYLRARWYQPETGTFLSRDAIESEPPYQYVRGNVVNLTDPSGRLPDECDFCDFIANGYAESYSAGANLLVTNPLSFGRDVVYDFATMERAQFFFHTYYLNPDKPFTVFPLFGDEHLIGTGLTTGAIELGITKAFIQLHRFESLKNIEEDYGGPAWSITYGLNTPVVQLGGGGVRSESDELIGHGYYVIVGAGIDLPLVLSVNYFATYAYKNGPSKWYTTTGNESGYVNKTQLDIMANDIRNGNGIPFPFKSGQLSAPMNMGRELAINKLYRTWVNHHSYFTKHFPECRRLASNRHN